MTLDEKLDEILEKYFVGFLPLDFVGRIQAHIDAKEAIKQLIEEEIEEAIEEAIWHRTIGAE